MRTGFMVLIKTHNLQPDVCFMLKLGSSSKIER
jgi:hypothetical protein